MRIQVLSDIHLDTRKDGFEVTPYAETLVIAGDIGNLNDRECFLEEMSKQFRYVVYVFGNHDYYYIDRAILEASAIRIGAIFPNVHWLNNSVVELEGVRFIGATMWFRYDPMNVMYESLLRDFQKIPNFKSWVYSAHEETVAYLNSELEEGDVVVTHHVPTRKSLSGLYESHILNRFYVAEHMEHALHRCKPALWLHGHTHMTCNYSFEKTKVICNPTGYGIPGYGVATYDGALVVEV